MKALDVAKYIINKCIDFEKPISNLPLQKIMYFVHIGYLKKTGEKLITDEKFEAWQWGPVVRNVYLEYRIFGSNALAIKRDVYLNLDKEDKIFIDNVIKESLNLRPWELVQKSHNPNGAWAKVYKEGEGAKKSIIPDDLIEQEANA